MIPNVGSTHLKNGVFSALPDDSHTETVRLAFGTWKSRGENCYFVPILNEPLGDLFSESLRSSCFRTGRVTPVEKQDSRPESPLNSGVLRSSLDDVHE